MHDYRVSGEYTYTWNIDAGQTAAYQAGLSDLWEKYRSLNQIPDSEIAALCQQYPLAEPCFVRREYKATFDMITKLSQCSVAISMDLLTAGMPKGIEIISKIINYAQIVGD